MNDAKARIWSRLRDERGIALVMAMGVLLVISVSLTGVIYFSSANARSSSYAQEEQSAVGLAEAGLNDALATIFEPTNDVNLDDETWLGSEASPFTVEYPGGTVRWYGQLNDCDAADPTGCDLYWLITSKSEVDNPTGPGAADIHRTLTVRVPMKEPYKVMEGVDLWNWVYSNQETGNDCDMTIDQGVDMYVPLYVKGNLCMWSTAKLHTGPVLIGGNLSLKTSQNSVGTASVPLSKARIGGWCRYWNKPTVTACKAEGQNLPHSPTNVFATDFSNNLGADAFSLPGVYWWSGDIPATADPPVGWYEKASPGPFFGCKTVNVMPPTFDNNTAMDHSVPGIFNLTPPDHSYSCVTRRGQLTWDYLSRTLTVRGVIFIDGNVEVNNNSGVLRYVQGEPACTVVPEPGDDCSSGAVIYVGGTVSIKNSKLCAVVTANECDWDNWEPNINILVFAAYEQGLGQVSAGTGISVDNSHFQGALYGKYAVDAHTAQTRTQGPLVSETQVLLGQQAGSSFPPVTINPLGMPGTGPEFYQPQNPDYGTPFGDPTYG